MKLTAASIEALENVIKTAQIAQLQVVLFDVVNGVRVIRGVDKESTVQVLSATGCPDLGDLKIGINRVNLFGQRLALLKSQGNVEIEATLSKNNIDVSKLELQSGKTKTDFRCCNVDLTNGVPKSKTADTEAYEITIPTSAINLLVQSSGAMSSPAVTLSTKDGKVMTLEFADEVNNDILKTEIDIETKIVISEDDSDQVMFANTYSLKSLIPLFKEASKSSQSFNITIDGLGGISIFINNIKFIIGPIA